jgi:hypothetical protein
MMIPYSAISLFLALLVISACAQDENTDSIGENQSNSVEPILTEVVIDAGSVVEALNAYQEGHLEPGELLITYSDLHPLHGGLEINVDGLGHVQQEALWEEVKEPEDLTLEEMVQLVNLIIDLEAWKQIVPERTPLPDESRAILWIQAGESESQMWEWYNDMFGNNRLIQIREMMKQFAWEYGQAE